MSLVEKRKSKAEVEELFEIGIATPYRWLQNKSFGQDLRATQSVGFIKKNIQIML